MTNTELFDLWRARAVEDPDLLTELDGIRGDADAINDRFYRDLAFGTGGLRGVIGAGSNRMNIYTIRRATQGLADYINAAGLPKKVAIGHDSRHKGELFSREAARVLAANGITAYLYPRLEPTPALSWAVRYLGCGAGICVTASHNPAKYNGYKVYGADGCQVTVEAAAEILSEIEKLDLFVVRTMCTSKDEYLTRPDLGRKLNPEGVAMVKEKCKKNPTVQIFVSDGLSSAAVVANIPDLLPALMQGLQSYGIDVGTPFFVEYGRVGVEDEITELTGATVTCDLVGERPGLITAESMSAYITYKGTVGMPEARRTVISNIHKDGTPPVEAGAHIAEVIKIMLEKKASGTDLKL